MDVLQYLRESTRTQHAAIEGRLDLLRTDLTVREYRRLLERFYGFYEPLEAALAVSADWKQLQFPFQERRKVGLIRQDLVYLGFTESQVQALPRCSRLPDVSTLASALGCLYVVEGATLGGQLIARHVGPLLRLTPDAGCGFFTSRGADVGRSWRTVGDLLRAQLQEEVAARQAMHAARDTFVKLDGWLARGAVA